MTVERCKGEDLARRARGAPLRAAGGFVEFTGGLGGMRVVMELPLRVRLRGVGGWDVTDVQCSASGGKHKSGLRVYWSLIVSQTSTRHLLHGPARREWKERGH